MLKYSNVLVKMYNTDINPSPFTCSNVHANKIGRTIFRFAHVLQSYRTCLLVQIRVCASKIERVPNQIVTSFNHFEILEIGNSDLKMFRYCPSLHIITIDFPFCQISAVKTASISASLSFYFILYLYILYKLKQEVIPESSL